MRKAFNFFRSYYDVAMELNDKDRLAFYDALLNKQFNNCEPTLNGMAKFAYLSQKHSIDTQIKGYFDKTKNQLFNPSHDPCQGGNIGGTVDPSVQEKEEEKEEEKNNIFSFDEFWNLYDKKTDRKKCEDKYKKLSLVQIEKIKTALPIYIKSKPDVQYRKNPLTWLNGECWNDEVKLIEQSNVNNNVLFVTPDGIEITDKLVLHTYQQTGFI